MEDNQTMKSILKGFAGAILLALMLLLILALVMTRFDLTDKVYKVVSVVLTTTSLVVGAVFSAKSNGSKGWLIGLAVGFLFFIFIYILGAIVSGIIDFSMVQVYKFIGCIIIGTIAGMLGVNM